ncbi:MAG: peptide/nickel transport system permease protein [Myxococcota bacterium]
MSWWVQPLVRLFAALALPFLVPAVITGVMWVLPGDPASIICPPAICTGTAELAARWGLDQGPVHFYTNWLTNAAVGEFGNSWRVAQGYPVSALLWESLPTTAGLVLLAMVPMLIGAFGAALGWLPRRLDPLWQAMGLIPAVILALAFAAVVQINFGALSHDGWPGMLRLLFGGLVLGIADGAFAGAVLGTRSTLEEELKQRYVQIAVMRGESVLSNTLPNVLPSLIGQFRARMLHVMSGAVVVEVVLGIPGLGELLWEGTLQQDFGVVLTAAWAFALLSAALLFAQAVGEIAVATHVRRAPRGVMGGAA